jgi:hypothetical protein
MVKKKERNRNREEYQQGLILSLLILVIGTVLEWVTGGAGASLPSWPQNIFIGLSFALIIVFIHFYYKDLYVIKWLSRVPASVSSILLFTLLTLILGLTKQNEPDASLFLRNTGLSHIRTSYTFLLSGMFLLTTLGLVIMRRISPLNYKNIGFALNHLGLWIIVLAGSLGAGDLQRLNIYVNEGESVWYAFDHNQQPRQVPFHLKLLDFDIEFYNPKIAYIETKGMKVPEKEIDNNFVMMEEGLSTIIEGWKIEVEKLLPNSLPDGSGNFIASTDSIAYASAKIKASSGNTTKEGWICYGGFMQSPVFLDLGNGYSLAMARQEPREYSSLIEVIDFKGRTDTSLLIVNKPVKVSNWSLYQLSYDEKMGKYSKLSIIEAINDPWLPIIYIGIFMVIGGALYLFTIGKKPKED